MSSSAIADPAPCSIISSSGRYLTQNRRLSLLAVLEYSPRHSGGKPIFRHSAIGTAMSSPREIARAVSSIRRDFLREITGAAAAGALLGSANRAWAVPPGRKAVVVTFGGGARDEETFMIEGQENIPHLLNDLIPRATFFSQVVNKGILGHYVPPPAWPLASTRLSITSPPSPPDRPTVFEYFRKDLQAACSDAWVVAPSNGFNRIGESGHRSYGPGRGAGVILPKRLLGRALPAPTVATLRTPAAGQLRNSALCPRPRRPPGRAARRWPKFSISPSPISPRTRAVWPAPTNSPSTSRAS